MAYYLNLFSPETYEAFLNSDRTVSGFRENQWNAAQKLKKGDKLVCYVTRISRWVGILEVVGKAFKDGTSIFIGEDDPFIVRFNVKPKVTLSLDKSVPIKEDFVWNELSFTKGFDKNVSTWTGSIRNSLRWIPNKDGLLIERVLLSQNRENKIFEFSEDDKKEAENINS